MDHGKGLDPLYDHDYDQDLGYEYDNGWDLDHLESPLNHMKNKLGTGQEWLNFGWTRL